MSNKSILTIIALIFLSTAFLFSCITHKYSKTSISGIRKVEKFDDDVHIDTFRQKHDDATDGWFEAEKNDAGEWNFTAKGKKDRDRTFQMQQSGGDGGGGGGGGGSGD